MPVERTSAQISMELDLLINQRLDAAFSKRSLERRKSFDMVSVSNDISSFARFLNQNHCLEILLFWKEVEQYKASFSNQERAAVASKILDTYLSETATWQVTFKGEFAATVTKSIANKEFPEELYDGAQAEVYEQMRLDLYPRFMERLDDMKGSSPLDEEPAESLKVVLMGTQPAATRSFSRFAREALCEEALLFWVEANDYALLFQPSDMLSRAAAIYETYMSPDAKYKVNLSDKIIESVDAAIKSEKCHNALFKTSQTEVSEFLGNDVFPRYLDWLKTDAAQVPVVRQKTDKKLLDGNLLGDRHAMLEALKELLLIPEEMAALRRVARDLHAEENLEFYSEIQEYRKLFSEQDRLDRATYMYKRYIDVGADHLVTLPDHTVSGISKELVEKKSASATLFDDAYRETMLLCTDNIYPVYLKKVNSSDNQPDPDPPSTGGCCAVM
mmetsp:Transcript_12693/g.25603  ORF Transcript_12693/g.25603 Transcript_12693/m.25603 type:complete len:445 (-) Transcript_12693:708-2042(-)